MEHKPLPTVIDKKLSESVSVVDGSWLQPEMVASTDKLIYIDPIAEAAVMKKFDRYLLPQAFLFILLNYLDRSNLGNARVFGFDADIGLVGTQFNNINTLFFVPYILMEVPWVTMVKRFGPNKILAIALIGWSSITIGTGFIQNYHQAIACRMLLGVFEAGIAPSFGFVFSTVYDRKSTAKRIALINMCNVTSGALGGLLAYSIQRMGAQLGLAAWRWLFIIEGSVTLVTCGACWFTFPNKPETAWFLNEEEKKLMVLRKERDSVFRGDDKFDWKYVKMALKDPFVYLASGAFFFSSVAIFGFSTFLPTIIRGFGYDAFQANYLTIPVYFVGALSLAVQAYFSDRLQKRALFLLSSGALVITGYLICVATASQVAGYVAMFVCCGGVYTFSCIIITAVATNLAPDYKLSIGLPLFESIGNLSGLVASQLYPSSAGPRYISGNAASAGMEAVALLFVGATWLLLRKRNLKKEKLIAEGATTNGKEGDMALDFKYTF